MNDLAVRRCRQHIETIRRFEPGGRFSLTNLIEDVFDYIETSDLYYSIRRHQEIVDQMVDEALSPAADAEAFDRGYRQAMDDINDLAGNTVGNNSGDAA